MGVTAQVPGRAERTVTQFVPGTHGRFFRIAPTSGRWLTDDDDRPGANQVAVISPRLWREWFGAQPGIAGQASIRINLKSFTIVGIAPERVRIPGEYSGPPDIWLPLSSVDVVDPDRKRDGLRYLSIFIRPRPNVTAAQLTADVRAALPNPTMNSGRPGAPPVPVTLGVEPAREMSAGLSSRRDSWLSVSLSTLILIAACANLANLLYARGLQRMGEVAVRASLGASTGRLLRLFIAETAVIAALASLLGLAIAVAAMELFAAAVPAFETRRFGGYAVVLSPDVRMFVYAFGAGTIAALLVGVTTAWRTSRVPPLRVLAGSGAAAGLTVRGGKTRTILVAVQVTAAVVVVMASGFAVERYRQDRARSGSSGQPTYDQHLLASVRVNLDLPKYSEARGRAFFDQLLAKARTLPRVESAAITGYLWGGSLTNLETEPPATGRVGSPTLARVYTTRISPGFLQTLGIRLTRGRDFTPSDTDVTPKVALVSESAVAHLFPRGEDPIGQRIKFGPWDWLTIVGITEDAVRSDDTGPARPSNTMYIPFAQWYQTTATLVVRSTSPSAVLEPLRLAVNEVNPDVAVSDVTTSDQYVRRNRGLDMAFGSLITALGAIALAIAMLGVYGVVAYFVTTRRREFGIRLALGATPRRVLKLVIDHAVHVVLVGLLPGVLIVSVGTRFTQARVNAFTPMNITTWFVVPVLILAAGILAGYVPARRAARVDPNVALRDL
jgi:predicted permease